MISTSGRLKGRHLQEYPCTKKTASVLILSTILLAACSKEEPKAALDCAQPATLQNIRTTIEDTLKQQARSFARNDNRQFVDADKIIAAGLELETLLEDPKETEDDGKAICRAKPQNPHSRHHPQDGHRQQPTDLRQHPVVRHARTKTDGQQPDL